MDTFDLVIGEGSLVPFPFASVWLVRQVRRAFDGAYTHPTYAEFLRKIRIWG